MHCQFWRIYSWKIVLQPLKIKKGVHSSRRITIQFWFKTVFTSWNLKLLKSNSHLLETNYSWLQITRTFKGNWKELELWWVWVNGGMGFLLTPLITHSHRKNRHILCNRTSRNQINWYEGQLDTLKIHAAQFFSNLIQNEFNITLTNEVRVTEAKIMKNMTWRKNNHFELAEGSSYQGFKLLRVKLQ